MNNMAENNEEQSFSDSLLYENISGVKVYSEDEVDIDENVENVSDSVR